MAKGKTGQDSKRKRRIDLLVKIPALKAARRFRLGGALALIFALVASGGCAALFSPPSVEIVGVELVSLGLTSGTAAVTLDLVNEGSRTMNIRGVLYELSVQGSEADGGWARVAGGFHSREIVLPGDEVRRVRLPVTFDYEAVGAAFRSFVAQGEVPYRLQGEVSMKGLGVGFDVPFRSEGVLKE